MLLTHEKEALSKNQKKVHLDLGKIRALLPKWAYANNPSSGNRFRCAFIDSIWLSLPPIGLLILIAGILWMKGSAGADGDNDSANLFKGITLTSFFPLIAGWLAILGAAYWNLDSIYGRQWVYCANLYYQFQNEEDADKKKLKYCCLVSDLLDMKLWAGKGWQSVVFSTLRDAAIYCDKEGREFEAMLVADRMTLDAAFFVLHKYSDHLRDEIQRRPTPDKKSDLKNVS